MCNNWQPIETAPKDGTRIILANSNKMYAEGWYEKSRLYLRGSVDCTYHGYREVCQETVKPTHWMLMPSLPSDNAKVE